jgi:hypothetical protein
MAKGKVQIAHVQSRNAKALGTVTSLSCFLDQAYQTLVGASLIELRDLKLGRKI